MMEIYHIISRGVDRRRIFLDDQDYLRFIHDLFEFNDVAPASTASYHFFNPSVIARRQIGKGERKPRKLLVNILAFCLMPNHYHLLLMSKIKSDISKFMKKLNMGYARYFNERYKRSGALFEGRYKSVFIKNEAHFIYVPYYIHFNPLDLISPEWRNRELKNYKKAVQFLRNYRWSSHSDYCGEKNFPSVTQREFLIKFFGGHQKYRESIGQWLKDISLETISDVVLE